MHWRELNSTTFKSELKIKLWMCNVTFQKGNCVSLCTHSKQDMYMYFMNCMYADAFVFIQGKKKRALDQTVFEGNVLLFLRSYPCRNIFEK